MLSDRILAVVRCPRTRADLIMEIQHSSAGNPKQRVAGQEPGRDYTEQVFHSTARHTTPCLEDLVTCDQLPGIWDEAKNHRLGWAVGGA